MALTDHIRKDSPTNSFATWNSLDTTATVSDGNLKVVTGNVKTFSNIFLPKLAGKFYVEYYVESMGYPFFGVYNHNTGTHSVFYSTNQSNESIKIKSVNTANTFEVSNGDIVSVLVDTTNETIQWFKNGGSTSSNTSSSYTLDDLADNDYSFYTVHASGAGTSTIRINFGQDSSFGGNKTDSAGPYTDANGIGEFYYQPPAGALALCAYNSPTPSIDPVTGNEPEDFFKCSLYTATGSTQSISVGFQPDLVWIKGRDAARVHIISDSVRGITYYLIPNILNGETNISGGVANNLVKSTSTTGFTIGSDSAVNVSSEKFVAWCWRAGGTPSGATSATGSAKRINTSGTQDDTICNALATATSATITPTLMSINQQVGFSIVSYTSNPNSSSGITDTLPHGLTSAPEMIIIKQLNNSSDWMVWHKGINTTNYNLNLNNSGGEFSVSAGGIRTPNASAIDLGGSLAVNSSWSNTAQLYICYSWHSIPGYSAFGSYTGNGTSDGPFVYTGFRPSFVMIKNTSATADWIIIDSARDEFNSTTGHALYPSLNFTEANLAAYALDLLSNGFKIRNNGSEMNRNGNTDTFIYMAFAEQPINYANAR